jgi:hypothetical protein
MNRYLLIFSILMVTLISCGEQPAVATATATFAPTASATPTVEPSPTPTATSTPIPSPTPSSTPLPTPTTLACDQEVVGEAMEAINDLEYYRTEGSVRGNVAAVGSMLQIMTMNIAYVMDDGDIEATELTIDYAGELGRDIHAVVIGDSFYMELGPGEWEVMSGEFASRMLDSLVGSQLLKPELVEQLETASCTVTAERLEGRETEHYHYEDVDVSAVTNLQGLVLGDMGIELSAATIDVWVTADDGIILPVRTMFTLEAETEGRELGMELTLDVLDVNVPIEISVPEGVVAPTFALDIPLLEDAQVYLEHENIIGYLTASAPDEVHAYYQETLAELGWTFVTSGIETAEGITMETNQYTRDGVEVVVGVAVQAGQTIVVIAGGESP